MVDDLRNRPAHATAKTIWSNADSTRQFLIPDTLWLPPGDYAICTATGRRRLVDPDMLAPFEVSDEEAQAWAKARLEEVTHRLKSGLRDALLNRLESGQRQDRQREDVEATQQTSSTPGLDLLADITGTPRERLSGDYRAVGRALRDYLKDLTDTTGDALSGDPKRERNARRRMRDWSQTLREHGIAAADIDETDAASGNRNGAQDPDTPGGTGGPSEAGGQNGKP